MVCVGDAHLLIKKRANTCKLTHTAGFLTLLQILEMNLKVVKSPNMGLLGLIVPFFSEWQCISRNRDAVTNK